MLLRGIYTKLRRDYYYATQRSLSDDVIRIFHNAKGSVKNNVEKWVNHNDAQMSNSEESADIGWN